MVGFPPHSTVNKCIILGRVEENCYDGMSDSIMGPGYRENQRASEEKKLGRLSFSIGRPVSTLLQIRDYVRCQGKHMECITTLSLVLRRTRLTSPGSNPVGIRSDSGQHCHIIYSFQIPAMLPGSQNDGSPTEF
ncbi:hypothetical protein RRG08_038591 [Elysia crispata]|uniref:Uncharacterized protein n=1 Tax=Elysia crispata TaxID=231223 RepID=A0AAE1ATL9_9GAST|nr:hypothetical protein RRG08_038591 [Elysia crispata]